jgi:hypothetical protein
MSRASAPIRFRDSAWNADGLASSGPGPAPPPRSPVGTGYLSSLPPAKGLALQTYCVEDPGTHLAPRRLHL